MRILPDKTVDIRRESKRCPTCARRFSRDAGFCPFDGERLVQAAIEATRDALAGTTIDGRYEVLDVIGEGGMGRVYRVRHVTLDRAFAMKVLRRDLARDALLAARFIHEAKATASVRHPHVVQITDFGTLGEAVPYFVMELLIGWTLGDALRAGPVPARAAVRILQQVADGVGAAHAAGIVHRDLKPDNVFLVESPADAVADGANAPARPVDVRVVDFGASKIVGASRITRTGVVFGTPYYMSPEQASGQPVDPRADVYALGVVMYEMLTGRLPFEADTYMGVLTQHMFAEPASPSEVGIAEADLGFLEAVTLKCLRKRPQDRFASMSDLLSALESAAAREALFAGTSVADRPARRPPRAEQGHASAAEAFVGGPEALRDGVASSAPPPRTRRRGTLAFVAVVFLLGSAALVLLLRSDKPGIGAAAPAGARPAAARAASAAPGVAPTPEVPPAVASNTLEAASAVPSPAASRGPAPASPSPASRHPAQPHPAPVHGQTGFDDVGDPFAAHR